MKKFLVIKSTKQQLREGVEQPVDTAYIESRGGRLHLKAVFEVKNFKPEEINVQVCFSCWLIMMMVVMMMMMMMMMMMVVVVMIMAVVVGMMMMIEANNVCKVNINHLLSKVT